MTACVDPYVYFAKATWPVGNTWRSRWATVTEAKAAALNFVELWRGVGVRAKAAVFYRDGTLYCEFGTTGNEGVERDIAVPSVPSSVEDWLAQPVRTIGGAS